MKAAVPICLLLSMLLLPPVLHAQENGAPDVVVVEMVEKSATRYAFSPEEVTVTPGQTIRFVQKGQVPHNVEFRDGPSDAKLDGIRMGPFLMAKGETYEIRIDDAFTRGTYDYVCTPHEAMGMTGKIVVERRGSNRK